MKRGRNLRSQGHYPCRVTQRKADEQGAVRTCNPNAHSRAIVHGDEQNNWGIPHKAAKHAVGADSSCPPPQRSEAKRVSILRPSVSSSDSFVKPHQRSCGTMDSLGYVCGDHLASFHNEGGENDLLYNFNLYISLYH